jgi:hypothetical protein
VKPKKKLTARQRRKAGLPLHLSLSPQPIKPDEWYYEEPKHVHVVVWSPPLDRAYSRGERMPVHTRIPWSSLAKSLKRYRAYRRTVGKEGGQ